MTATREEVEPRRRPPLKLAPPIGAAPIVATVEPQTARVSAEIAARLARRFGASLIFVSIRPPRPAVLGDRHSERRWVRDMLRSRKALDAALAAASRNGVMAYGEILEGDRAAAIEFARARSAQMLVGASGAIHPRPASSDS